jgi:gliding motility-associated-like protein
MKRFFYLLFLILINSLVFATHERAGEIIYRHIDGLKYEATIITYTYSPSPADRPQLTLFWGDATSSVLNRIEKTPITNIIQRNVYKGEHSYAAPGIFKLSVEDPNRNYGIVNIPNSVNIPFYIETELIVNPFLGNNSSVILLNPPLDYGCVNRLYIHNPGAYDPDGDSLSYKLTICKGAGGLPIPGYVYPNLVDQGNPGSFQIDPYNGDLIWNAPTLQGEYNVAFIIEEWRFGQRIGYVTRDLQIQVVACNNNPPEIITISDTCINAGDSLNFQVVATDPDGDQVILSATGSPFLQTESPAEMDPNPAIGDVNAVAQFHWKTNCSHVLKNPHPVYFKAFDNDPVVSLSSYKTLNIKVVAPAPENPLAIPLGTSIVLNWEKNDCNNITGYYIYRRKSYYGFFPGHCETGVPAYTGYSKIAEVQGKDNTSFIDNDNGNGLIHGIEYCYMITAFFPDGAESYATEEVCAILKRDLPIITNVSVSATSEADGSVYVAWSKPTELDTIQIPGPYEYQLYRKDNSQGSAFTQVIVFNSLNDTIYNDGSLNTRNLQFRYRIDLWTKNPENTFFIGSTVAAPSLFLSIEPTDKALQLSWNNDVPWINDTFEIYRQIPWLSSDFELIDITTNTQYLDTGLENGKIYCYKIKSSGSYSAPGIIKPIINFSQENCSSPVDKVPPCPPVLTIDTNCEDLINYLTWIYPDTCQAEDSIYFKIYYSPSADADYSLIYTTGPEIYEYAFHTNPPSVVGCFSITALDTMHNESYFSNAVCVDINECGDIWFPNVLTPNSDNYNDFFQAYSKRNDTIMDWINSIKHLRLSIFNRWGVVVYETEDPYFKWDGRDQRNNRDCSSGVYFYEGLVSVYTISGAVDKKVRGSVTLLR